MTQAVGDPHSVPLGNVGVPDSELFEADTLWCDFERLRPEDSVHHCGHRGDRGR